MKKHWHEVRIDYFWDPWHHIPLMKGLMAIFLSCLLVSSVVGMTKQSSHAWVEIAKAGHTCSEGRCCSDTPQEKSHSCACGPCDITTPPATPTLYLPPPAATPERTSVHAEYILPESTSFSSLNRTPPVPPPRLG